MESIIGLTLGQYQVVEQIGKGLTDERGFEAGVDFIQGFEGGVIFRDSDGQTRGLAYVLFKDDQTYVREGY
jgi:hypothetical protein